MALAESRNPETRPIPISVAAPKTRNPDFTGPKTAGFVPDFASTTGHSIPDPDDPETRSTEKNGDPGPKTGYSFTLSVTETDDV